MNQRLNKRKTSFSGICGSIVLLHRYQHLIISIYNARWNNILFCKWLFDKTNENTINIDFLKWLLECIFIHIIKSSSKNANQAYIYIKVFIKLLSPVYVDSMEIISLLYFNFTSFFHRGLVILMDHKRRKK